MRKLERRVPVRVSMVGAAFLAYIGTPALLLLPSVREHVETVYTALMALLGLVTAAIGGDSYRPSGMAKDAPSDTSVGEEPRRAS